MGTREKSERLRFCNIKQVPNRCKEYESLFQNDPSIDRAEELSQLVDGFPRLEHDEEDDYEYRGHASTPAVGDAHILEMFSDL